MNKALLVATLLTCFFLKYGDCVKCYECSSLAHPGCGEPFATENATSYMSDCKNAEVITEAIKKLVPMPDGANDKINACVNMKFKLPITGSEVIARGCANENMCESIKSNQKEGDSITCSTCTDDYCNYATSLKLHGALYASVLASLSYFYWSH